MENKKKKILFVTEAFGVGVYTYIRELGNRLIDDYDIYLAYSVRKQTPDKFEKDFNSKIKLITLKNFERSINPIKDIMATFELRRIVKHINPDIIHLHSSKAGVLGRWVINTKKYNMFYTPHGYSFLMKDINFLKKSLYFFIEKLSGYKKCTTISCSRGEYMESLKLTKYNTYVNNGINISEDSVLNKINTTDGNTNTVVTIGRICTQKNPYLFNEIAKLLPEYNFIWIGDGELRDVLTEANITVTGWLDNEDVLTECLKGRFFVLTSLWEGLPISLLEAMYLRRVCIVSNVIGNNDVIQNRINGFICDSADEFVNYIKNTKISTQQKLIENAHNDIKNKYNVSKMAMKYKQIYEGISNE